MKARIDFADRVGDYVSRVYADEAERKSVIAGLKSAVNGRADDEEFLSSLMPKVQLVAESSLHFVHTPARIKLAAIVLSSDFQIRLPNIAIFDYVRLTSEGRLEGVLGPEVYNIGDILQKDPAYSETYLLLTDFCKSLGGEINLDDSIRIEHWLTFHGFNVPANVEHARTLMAFLEWQWSFEDDLGDYWDHINGHDVPSAVLTPSQCKEINALTATFVPVGKSLLDTLYRQATPSFVENVSRRNANETISKMVTHPAALELARKYIRALGWYGAQDEYVQDNELSQVLLTALILELNPNAADIKKRNHMGSFNIYSANETVDQPLLTVRERFERHLTVHHKLPPELAPLAAHLLLADLAPALLVKDVPFSVTVGSIPWITFCQAVMFVEFKSKGASRFMNYDQIMLFSDMDTLSPTLGQLQSLGGVGSIADWALVNGVITDDELATSSSDACAKALATFQQHLERLTLNSTVWRKIPPSRRETALIALRDAAPFCHVLESKILRHYTDKFATSYQMSMCDLHIEGDLTSEEWDRYKGTSIYFEYPHISKLPSNDSVFKENAREHLRQLNMAMMSNVKLVLAQIPESQRDIFDKHEVHFFTVRPSVAVKVYSSSGGLIGTGGGKVRLVETQANRDAATGRFGVVMYVEYGKDKYLCYEIFAMQGKCWRNDALGDFINRAGRINLPSRVDYKGNLHDPVPEPRYAEESLDLNSYTHGIEPRANMRSFAIMDKLGSLPPATVATERKSGIYQYFMSPSAERIAQYVITHRPLATEDEFVKAMTDLTERELVHKKTEEVVGYLVDLVVPFKKCIEDIESGDKNRIVDGVYGCTMDALGMIFTVFAISTKVLVVATRSASLAAKVTSLVKFGLKLTVSTFNPVDGLPTAGYQLSTTLLKGGMSLGKSGIKLVESATFQLRRVTGSARSVDLLQLANLPTISKGKWRPRGSIAEYVEVCSVTRNNSWYAVSRSGRPWGRKMLDFTGTPQTALPLANKSLPDSYTRDVVRQAMPMVDRKISSAIEILSKPESIIKTDVVMGLFFGTTPEMRDKLMAFLRTIRIDIAGWSISNFFLDPLKDKVQVVQVDTSVYEDWRRAAAGQKAHHQFLSINCAELNSRFSSAGFKIGEVADDLVHEMFRASTGRSEVASATVSLQGRKGLNVAPLLNLAAGYLAESSADSTVRYHSASRALENADTFAVTTALLHQFAVDEPMFARNLETIFDAVAVSANKPIVGEVWIELNTR